jgi:hypothetical protein
MAGSCTGKVEQSILEYSLPRIGEEMSRCAEPDEPPNSSKTQTGRATNGKGPIKHVGPSHREQFAEKRILQL